MALRLAYATPVVGLPQRPAAPATRSPRILEARGLIKSYGGKRVVDGLDLDLERGSVLGLLGPNGAGKTTTLRMLYGFIEPEGGEIRYDGLDFAAHRTRIKRWIGVCTQENTLDEDFTVRRNLEVYAGYFRPRVTALSERVDELLEAFGLTSYADRSPVILSGGYKRRLQIARSVIHGPSILFLDEPTSGLDPRARVDVWELIDRLRREGLAIILTTHYMDEAERLSDRLVVLSRGVAVATGPPRTLLGELMGEHVVVLPLDFAPRAEAVEWAEQQLGDRPASILGQVHIPMTASQLIEFSGRFGTERFTVRPPTLDDLFIKLSVEPDKP